MRTSFQSKRLKTQNKTKQTKEYLDRHEHKQQLQSHIYAKEYQTNEHLKRSLQELQILLHEEKNNNQELGKNLLKVYTKGIERQREYKDIIQSSIPYCIKEKSTRIINADLKMVHNNLITLFDESNRQHESQLQTEANMIEQMMQKKIRQLQEHTYKQLQNNKKYLKLNYQKIQRQISQILTLSVGIYSDYQNLKEHAKKLQFNNKVLKQQKQLLINEVLDKKNIIRSIYKDLKVKLSKDEEVNKFIKGLKDDRKQVQEEYQRIMASKHLVSQRSYLLASNFGGFQGEKIMSQGNNESVQYLRNNSNDKRSQKLRPRHTETIQTLFSSKKDDFTKNYSKTITINQNKSNKYHNIIKNRRIASEQSVEDSKLSKATGNKTIYHLEQTLRRQKKKVEQLKRELIYLREYHGQIQKIMRQLLLSNKNKTGDKILTLIKELKNRLINNNLEPRINVGFQDINMEVLMENLT